MQIKKITDLISNTTEQSLPSCVKSEILTSFENFNPEKYAKTRNYLDGHISRLSIAIKHGIVTNQEIFNLNKQKYSYIESEKFIQELAWRDFWRSYAYQNPDYLWKDVEEYKTGYKSHDYRDELPNDFKYSLHEWVDSFYNSPTHFYFIGSDNLLISINP